MKIYCIQYNAHAGKWIYNGYAKAWESMGYSVENLNDIDSVMNDKEDYIVMLTDAQFKDQKLIKTVEKSYKTFVFAQPNMFPKPWGTHPNFVSTAKPDIIKLIDSMDNIYPWTFADVKEPSFFSNWTKKIHTVPLAFDSIGYKPNIEERYKKYDISFVGGWADNGFNEKKKIIIDIFSEFKKSGLSCGFFVNKGLTHQQECDLIANSKVTLNIHDAYQRSLGLDTNERTFKSLGLNGALISDKVNQLNKLFPNVPTSLGAKDLVRYTKELLSLTDTELNNLKEENRLNVLNNHCYTNRIETLLKL